MSSQPGTTYGTRFRFEETNCTVYSGSGSPEGVRVGSVGDLYVQSDAGAGESALWHKATGTATTSGWEAVGSSADAAPDDSTYLVQTADGDLANAQAMGALATGLVKNTTTTGVQSIAEPDVDYLAPTSVVDAVPVTTQMVGVTTLDTDGSPVSPTTLMYIAMADGDRIGGELSFVVEVTDASDDNEVMTGAVRFAAERKGAAIVTAIGDIADGVLVKSHAGDDLVVAATCDGDAGDEIALQLAPTTVLTPTICKAHWHLTMLKGHGAITVYERPPTVEVLVVGGGGAGGARVGAGGGAGGVVYDGDYEVSVRSPWQFPVLVGLGGAAATDTAGVGVAGNDGEASSFDGVLIAYGGGGGGAYATPASGRDGACGGGAGGYTAGSGGTGSQGYDGGGPAAGCAGGGGGMGEAGADGVNGSSGGDGGDGVEYAQFAAVGGSPAGWFGGGGGGSRDGADANGGAGGGGASSSWDRTPATSGVANTGGGGGGVRDQWDAGGKVSGAGGDGVVIVRYPDGTMTATGGSVSSTGGYTYHVFIADGTFEITG